MIALVLLRGIVERLECLAHGVFIVVVRVAHRGTERADEFGEQHLAAVDAEFIEDHAHMVLHRAVSDVERCSDVLIRLAVHHEHEHLALL